MQHIPLFYNHNEVLYIKEPSIINKTIDYENVI